MDEQSGTYQFMAPELLSGNKKDQNEPYPYAVDIWSLGVTFYTFAYLKLPFFDDNLIGLFNAIKKNSLTFPKDNNYSKEFCKLLEKMMHKNLKKRIKLEQLVYEEFLNKNRAALCDEMVKTYVHVSDEEVNSAFLKIEKVVLVKSLARKMVNNSNFMKQNSLARKESSEILGILHQNSFPNRILDLQKIYHSDSEEHKIHNDDEFE